MSSSIQESFSKAKKEGYSDEEIVDHLLHKNPTYSPKIKTAIEEGYSPSEIAEFLGGKETESTQESSTFQNLKERASRKLFPEVSRKVRGHVARAAETIAGLPGNILEAPEAISQALGADPNGRTVKALKFAREMFAPNLLSSNKIREKITKPLTGEYLEPQSEGEEVSQEMLQDFINLAIPVGGPVRVLRPFLTTLGAQAAKQFWKDEGEGSGDNAKLGAMLVMGLSRRPTAQQFTNNLHREANSILPQNAAVASGPLRQALNGMRVRLQRGIRTPEKDAVLRSVEELEQRIGNGRNISVHELTEARRNANELIRGNSRIANIADAPGLRGAQEYGMNRFLGAIDDSLEAYGRGNPQWRNLYRQANEATRVMRASERISQYISGLARKHPIQVGAGLGSALLSFPGAIGTAGALAAGVGAIKSQQVIQRILQSPALRRHYTQLVTNAARENATVTLKDMEKLYNEAVKEGVWSQEEENQALAEMEESQ